MVYEVRRKIKNDVRYDIGHLIRESTDSTWVLVSRKVVHSLNNQIWRLTVDTLMDQVFDDE